MAARVSKPSLLASLPPEWPEDLMPAIGKAVAESRRKVVVLDDDPTGTQTVHEVPVLTEWSVELLSAEFANNLPVFFILTNSRSLTEMEARKRNFEIARNLAAAAISGEEGARDPRAAFVVVSRSDSTLRGHFPAEVEALSEVLGPFDAVLLVPFFETGGRHTIHDIHYLAEGEWLTPVAETQFARDRTFGYRSSNLRDWIEEKTSGRIGANAVASISIETIRCGGPDAVRDHLIRLNEGRVCVVNAASGRDLQVLIRGLLEAERRGRRFLYRTAASFAAVRAGLSPRPLLTRAEIGLDEQESVSGGGLAVVGSYVPISSEQLKTLLASKQTANVELDVRVVLSQDRPAREIELAARSVNEALKRNQDTVLYTSRELVSGPDPTESLAICRRVSKALTEILARVTMRPRFLVAKGGITSSDVATEALRVRRAMVLGQILPGVPLWRLGAESRWPGLIYVSFPGNLGGPDALLDVVVKLRQRQSP